LDALEDGTLVPSFDADVMQQIMEAVQESRWDEWKAVTAPATAVFAAKSMFEPSEQSDFIAARPATRKVLLPVGTHDAHLDATAEWAAALTHALEG